MKRSAGKRVLLIVENLVYPFDVRVRQEAHALRDAGYQVTVISPERRDPSIHRMIDGVEVYRSFHQVVEGVEVYHFPSLPTRGSPWDYVLEFGYSTLAMFCLTLFVWLRQGFDVIHVANPPDTLFVIGAAFKLLLGKRFVYDQHDLAPEVYLSRFGSRGSNGLYRLLCWLEYCSYSSADVVISTNESYRRIAMERGKKKHECIFVVRNGPRLSFGSETSKAQFPRQAPHLIGYVGAIGPQDGVDYWLRAIRELVATLKRTDFLAVIIGDGDTLPSLRILAKELDIESYVWFTGIIMHEEVPRYLSQVDICVQPDPLNPLNDKSTMAKTIEYLALGKPVVAFDLVETRFSAQGAACYARPNDVLDFAEKVAWLMDHPEERKAMGSFGRKRVAEALAWEYSVSHLLQAYDYIAGSKRTHKKEGGAEIGVQYTRPVNKG